MKEYKVFYVLSRPRLAEKSMEIELNRLAKDGWTLHSYAQPDIEHISAAGGTTTSLPSTPSASATPLMPP